MAKVNFSVAAVAAKYDCANDDGNVVVPATKYQGLLSNIDLATADAIAAEGTGLLVVKATANTSGLKTNSPAPGQS